MTTEAISPAQSLADRLEQALRFVAGLCRRRGVRLLLAVVVLLGLAAAAALFAAAMRIERIAMDAGVVYVTDLEWEGRVVEVEGYDRQLHETHLIVHLRTGEVLARSGFGFD